MPLEKYKQKRKFDETPEPAGKRSASAEGGGIFVVQKHAARRLHYDFRLEIDGVLKSWAVPKGPSLNSKDKRLAVETEDHPLEYGDFEGVIPQGNYGAGTVLLWDKGTYQPEGPLREQLEKGELKFSLHGEKLRGSFVLVRTKRSSGTKKKSQPEWLLIKHRDDYENPDWAIEDHPDSVVSGRSLEEVRDGAPPMRSGTAPHPGALEGAVAGPMPERPKPLLATLVEQPFSDPDWVFEVKWDGIRALAEIRKGECRLYSRVGRNITSHYPELADLAERVRAGEALIDGEIVTLDERGRGDFERLQSRMNVARPSKAVMEAAPITYYVFDILYCDGFDLRGVPLIERKQFLNDVLDPQPPVRYSDHVAAKGRELFEAASREGAEGVIGKHIHSAYSSGRSSSWVKFKVVREVDAVVGGFTAPQGSREHFGALLAGLYEGKQLRFVGGVGSGFSSRTQTDVFRRLSKLKTGRCPFRKKPDIRQKATWVKPQLVTRIKFHDWTRDGRLRQPVFLGLRPDLDPGDCQMESQRKTVVAARPPLASGKVITNLSQVKAELARGSAETVIVDLDGKRFRLTHLDKVYFPAKKYTKRQVLAYYFQAADFILPFLKNRPLVLHRFPNGIEADSFYQKAAGAEKPDWIDTVEIPSDEGRKVIEYYIANDLAALLFLTNLGCIEHHPWSSTVDALDSPDYVFFDLDPVEGTDFSTVVEVAREILRILERIDMKVFLKTSGATGFHLYLPLERGYSYEQVRAFAEIVARVIAQRMQDRVTLERKVGKRASGKVYVDYSQNAEGRPLASVYSVRPFPEATVGAPVSASELRRGLSPTRFTIKTMPARFKKTGDLWSGFFEARQRLEQGLEKLREEMRAL